MKTNPFLICMVRNLQKKMLFTCLSDLHLLLFQTEDLLSVKLDKFSQEDYDNFIKKMSEK